MEISTSLTGSGLENIEEAAKLLTFIDTKIVEIEDPATNKTGYHVSYETDLSMMVQLKQNFLQTPDITDFIGTLESSEEMHLRILIRGDEEDPENIGSIKLELTSEDDIFFHYVCELNEEIVNNIIEDQGLTIEYGDTLRILHKLIGEMKKHEVRASLFLDNI